MDFQNMNLLNVRINAVSGNLLPLAPIDLPVSITWKIYSAFLWLVQVIQTIALIFGLFMVPWKKSLIDGTVTFVVTIEVFFMVTRIHARKKLVHQLIQKLNDIMRIGDETMRSVVTTTLRPIQAPLKFYCIAGGLSVLLWCFIPFMLVFKKVFFMYEDYRSPAVFSKQPFAIDVFLIGSVIILISSLSMFLKKVGVDVYMIHLVLLITAQYRYIAVKLAMIFRDGNLQDEFDKSLQGHCSRVNQWAEKEIKALCRHYNTVIYLSSMLKELLSSNFSLIYVNNVFRFCFIGLMLTTVSSTTFLEACLIIVFASGAIVQFYMSCYSVQQLLDAFITWILIINIRSSSLNVFSNLPTNKYTMQILGYYISHSRSREITNKAFYEKWYQFRPSIRRTFMMMILSNTLECKISSYDKFNLSLPSFMTILNQSYSIALLLLRMK